MTEQLGWRCHTPNLLEEIVCNPECAILRIPIQILGGLLAQVAKRAIELNDPEMNRLMIRLTLYSVSDPQDPDYDKKLVKNLLYPPKGKSK